MAGLLAGCAGVSVLEPETAEVAVSEVEPGDIVQVETLDGTWLGFRVTTVTDTAVAAAGIEVPVSNIATVNRVLEGDRPVCGGREPLGCSIPESLSRVAEYHDRYKGTFHGACTTHDFCYRHGYRTYGRSRDTCDDTFHKDMKAICTGSWLDFDLVKKLEENARCLLVAEELYQGVRRYGEKHFRIENSSYCEYNGSPP